jgi:hypothetical protein
MYPPNTGVVLTFLGYEGVVDFNVRSKTGELEWYHADPQPTEQEIIDAGNDLTTVNGQVFSEWYAENGGDATLTLRRKAADALDKISDNEALIRALAFVVLDEINLLRAEHSLASRTPAQLRTAIKAKIAAGDADS